MPKQFLEAGKIVGTHGVRGDLKVQSWCDSPEVLCDFDTLYLDDKTPVTVRTEEEKVSTGLKKNKFGIAFEEALPLYQYIGKSQHLEARGIACHIGSQIFDYSAYELAVEAMVKFIASLNKEGVEVNVLNMGGGFGIYYAGEDPKFTPQRYAHTVRNLALLIENAVKKYNVKKPFLIVEPGRSIVGEAGITLYTVGTIKEIKGIRKYNATSVEATDLRGGAALLIAGLNASGTTEISNIKYILRGYENIDEKLNTLGANINIREGE